MPGPCRPYHGADPAPRALGALGPVKHGRWQMADGRPYNYNISYIDQLRDHTGQKRRYWLVLKETIRAAPCFFLHVLAWY
jgi:hypothetical protein